MIIKTHFLYILNCIEWRCSFVARVVHPSDIILSSGLQGTKLKGVIDVPFHWQRWFRKHNYFVVITSIASWWHMICGRVSNEIKYAIYFHKKWIVFCSVGTINCYSREIFYTIQFFPFYTISFSIALTSFEFRHRSLTSIISWQV